MSLGAVYIKCTDGNFYADPVFRGTTTDGRKWFLCFDEDDDPELVIEVRESAVTVKDAISVLKSLKVGYGKVRSFGVSGRCLTGSFDDPFEQAASFFISGLWRIPVPTEHDGVSK